MKGKSEKKGRKKGTGLVDRGQYKSGDTYAKHDGGDQYTGLDRFGRVIDQNWVNGTTGTSTDRYQYGYNADSEVVSRNNVLDAAMNESYSYDNLGQLSSFARGSHTQSWTPDALGNFTSVTTDGSTQTRTANQQNEYTSISGSGTISYDANGNLTADGNGNTYVYDAWNRLVSVKSGSTTVASYVSDGLNRQVQITENGVLTDLYYSSQGQSVEEYINGAVSAIDVWSPVYVNALVYRQQNGTRYYALQDANWNITAWVDTSGNIDERYAYDPYGAITVLSANWQVQSGSNLRLPYGFQGMRTDWYVGNLNFSQVGRVESPSLMRWLQNDYIGQAADINMYRMEGDQPTDMVDPSGLADWRNLWIWHPIDTAEAIILGVPRQWFRRRDLESKLDEANSGRGPAVDLNAPWTAPMGSRGRDGVNALLNPNFNRNAQQATEDIGGLVEVGMAASPFGLPFAPTKSAACLFQKVTVSEGFEKAGQLAGEKFVMNEEERVFAAQLIREGAEVYRSYQGANVGDFVVIYKGITYAVEIGEGGKTKKQLRAVGKLLVKGVEKLAGTADEVRKKILGK